MIQSSDRSLPATSSQWATFFLGGELFGFPVAEVQEVVRAQALTPVPLAPAHVAGLLSLRGEIMVAYDLRRFFDCAGPVTSKRFVIVRVESQPSVALVVDEIGDVLDLSAEGWRPASDSIPAAQKNYVIGIHAEQGQVLIGLRTHAIVCDDPQMENGIS